MSKTQKQIMIGCPVQEERYWVFPYYLNALKKLEYPKAKTHLAFLINNPKDTETSHVKDMLIKFKENNPKYYKIDIWEGIGNWEDQRVHGRFFSYFATIRNKWLEMLDEKDTHVFSVDSDVIVPPNMLRRLLDWNKDIISGLIFNGKSEHGEDSFNFMSKTSDKAPNGHYAYIHRNPGFLEAQSEWKQNPKTLLWEMINPAEVAMTGACVLIKRNVLDAGVRYGYRFQGEDIYFCEKAIENGFKVYCDFTITPTHIRTPYDLQSLLKLPQGTIIKPQLIDRKGPEPRITPEVDIIAEY